MRDSRSGYLAFDTIAAISTAPGGAIAVVRVSGPQAFPVLDRLTHAGCAAGSAPRRLARVRLRDPSVGAGLGAELGAEIDDALFARFVAPDSFTGEDLVELHVHGGAFGVSRVLEAVIAAGGRQALPGEFSFRAVRNGKLTLSQAQAVADLIAAPNDGALALALEKLSGSQSRALEELASGLRRLAVLSEAGIDFSDQDLDEVRLSKLQAELDPILTTLIRLEASYERGSRFQDGVRVALVGRPNVGKSSLFNALLSEDRSIVSEIPGTTRDVIRERLTLKSIDGAGNPVSITLRLEDTAGLRTATDPIENLGIERTLRSVRAADLVLFLVDSSATESFLATSAECSAGNSPVDSSENLKDAAEQQWRALSAESSLSQKTLGILTKADLSDPAHRDTLPRILADRFGLAQWVTTSATTGEGLAQLIAAITSFCERWIFREKGEVLLTRVDHLEAARAGISHLKRAREASELELFAADLRQALAALAPLIGETLADDILGRIFSDFCIGK